MKKAIKNKPSTSNFYITWSAIFSAAIVGVGLNFL